MNYRLSLLKKLSLKSTHHKNKHVTLLLKGGALQAFGVNKGKRHAEVDALKRLGKRSAEGMVALNFMVGRGLKIGNSFPCPHCLQELIEKGVKEVHYSDPGGFSFVRIS